jgi:Nucleotide-sugar transporter.
MNTVFIYSFMLGVLIFGTANTLISKAMDQQSAKGHEFNHPYFQTATMFLGESFCLVAYRIYLKSQNTRVSVKKELLMDKTGKLYNKLGNFIFLIPAFFDLVASTLTFIGLVLSAASVYQMMRGFIIVVVAAFSVFFLKRRLFRHQILGGGLAFIGVVIVGISSILFQASSAPDPVLGIILILVAQLFHGGMFVTEELFLSRITIDPLQAVGIEGVCGLGYYIILLPILYVIPCNQDFCVNGRVEDTALAFEQIAANMALAFTWVSSMVSVSLFNWTGISTTKYAGSLARSTIDTSRTLLVWLASMLLGWEEFIWPQLIGFFFLGLGTMVYNEVIVIPLWGFKEAVIAHQKDRNSRNKEYLATDLHSEKYEKQELDDDPSLN